MNKIKSNEGIFARRSILLLLAFVLTMLLIQGCANKGEEQASAAAAPQDGAQIPAVLNYGYIGTSKLNYPGGAEGWGFYKGIIQEELKKHGITEVKLTAFPNGPDLSESLISGRLDLGSLGDTPAILAKSTGAPTRLITQSSTHSIGYLIGKKGGPTKLEDLHGKTVSTQKGSFHHRYLAGLLKANNISDVKIVHMLRVDAEAALARGEIDAMTNTDIFAFKQTGEGYPLIDDASKHHELLGSGVAVVTENYLSKFPDFAAIWNQARLKALQDLKAHPDEYYQFLAELNHTTIDLVKRTLPIEAIKDVPFTDEGIQLLNGTKKFLVDEKLAAKDFELNDWILK